MCKQYPGFLRVALQDPQPERRFSRRGWVTYTNDVNVKETCYNLNQIRVRIHNFYHTLHFAASSVTRTKRYTRLSNNSVCICYTVRFVNISHVKVLRSHRVEGYCYILSLSHILDVMFVWRQGNISNTVSVLQYCVLL